MSPEGETMEYEAVAVNLPTGPAMRAYLEAAEWAGINEESEREALRKSDAPRWTEESIRKATADVEDFITANAEAIEASGLDPAHVGHNFYLSRNGHGAGFFDSGAPNGDELQRAAKVYGSTFESYDTMTESLESR